MKILQHLFGRVSGLKHKNRRHCVASYGCESCKFTEKCPCPLECKKELSLDGTDLKAKGNSMTEASKEILAPASKGNS